MRIPLDRDAAAPLHRQIHDHLVRLIGRGVLAAGDRLPPTRQLAEQLGVTRSTVNQAYETLSTDGIVRTAVGAGTFVATPDDRRTTGAAPDRSTEVSGEASTARHTRFDWDGFIGDRAPEPNDASLGGLLDADSPPDAVNWLRPIPDPELVPTDDVRRAFRSVLRTLDGRMLDYASPWGYEPLRARVARSLAIEDMDRSGDQTLLVNGSTQGLDILVRTLLAPGEVVVTERPAYQGSLRVFQSAQAQIRGLPLDDEGIDVDALERTLRQEPVRLIHVTPTFQNPTGRTMSLRRLRRILALAKEHQVPIIEDGCFRDLRYEGAAVPALKSLDDDGLVVHLGTLSKSLFPGLRVGWLAAPARLAERLAQSRRNIDLGSVTLAQMAIDRMLADGVLARHIDRIRTVYRRRRDALLTALDAHLPDGVRWTIPEGGMTVWLELPAGLGSLGVVRRAATAGVLVAPGALFDSHGQDLDGVRIAFSTARSALMDVGAERLGAAIRKEMKHRGNASHARHRLPTV